MCIIIINAPNSFKAKHRFVLARLYNHLEQGPKFPKVDIRDSGVSLPTRAPNPLQSIITRLRPMAMPEEAFHQDHSTQSEDSGDRQHCDDRHYFYSDKCQVTQWIHNCWSPFPLSGWAFAPVLKTHLSPPEVHEISGSLSDNICQWIPCFIVVQPGELATPPLILWFTGVTAYSPVWMSFCTCIKNALITAWGEWKIRLI